MPYLRSIAFSILAPLAVLGAARRADAGPHPYFDDRGTLEWYSDLDRACAAARSQGKLVFIDSGRLHCGNCRSLVTRLIPDGAVRTRMGAVAVGFADDCDHTDPRVGALVARWLPNAQLLPLVGFVTPDLEWVTGWSGSTDVAAVGAHLSRAESVVSRARAARKARDDERCRAEEARTRGIADAERIAREEADRRARRASAPACPPAPCAPPPPPPAACPPPPPCTPPAEALPPVDESPCDEECPGGVCAAPRARDATPPERPAPASPPPVAAPAPKAVPAPAPAVRPLLAAPSRAAATVLPPPRVLRSSLLERARDAAASRSWGALARIGDEAEALPRGAERSEVEALAQRAHQWTLDTMAAAVRAAEAGRTGEALALLGDVRREMGDRPVARDVDRGVLAIERLESIQFSPDGGPAPDLLRRQAYADFRGSRWAALFRRG